METWPAALSGITLFLGTGRARIIESADPVFVTNENRLVDVGTHQSLLESGDYYRALVSYQGKDGVEEIDSIPIKLIADRNGGRKGTKTGC